MDIRLYIEQFEVIKGEVEKYLEKIDLPVSTATDELDIYNNVAKLRDQRNKLLKYGNKIRRIKRFLTPFVQKQKDAEDLIVDKFLSVEANLKGLKTKDERDIVIRARILRNREADDDFVDFVSVQADIDSVLLDINITIQELQRTFDEYNLIYNFEKLVSTGNLIKFTRHPLDMMSK